MNTGTMRCFSLCVLGAALVLAGCSHNRREYVPNSRIKAFAVAVLCGPRGGLEQNEGRQISGWEFAYAIPGVGLVSGLMFGFKARGGETAAEHVYYHNLAALNRDPVFWRLLQACGDAKAVDEAESRWMLRHLAMRSNYPTVSGLQEALKAGAISDKEYLHLVSTLTRAVMNKWRGRNPYLDKANVGLLAEARKLKVLPDAEARRFIRAALADSDQHDALLIQEACDLGIIDEAMRTALLRRLYLLYAERALGESYDAGDIDKPRYRADLAMFTDEIEKIDAAFDALRLDEPDPAGQR